MLDPPLEGGGLRVWDVTCDDGLEGHDDDDLERESLIWNYEAGDLLLMNSYRLHQIQPFAGPRDRISATCHAAWVAGRWETWF